VLTHKGDSASLYLYGAASDMGDQRLHCTYMAHKATWAIENRSVLRRIGLKFKEID
jgi:hypothetical protein